MQDLWRGMATLHYKQAVCHSAKSQKSFEKPSSHSKTFNFELFQTKETFGNIFSTNYHQSTILWDWTKDQSTLKSINSKEVKPFLEQNLQSSVFLAKVARCSPIRNPQLACLGYEHWMSSALLWVAVERVCSSPETSY